MHNVTETFRRAIEEARVLLSAINEDESRVPRAVGKWSPKEIIGHLIDSAANNHQRFIRAQFTDDLLFPGYEQDRWVLVQHYNDEPWKELVQLWEMYNRHLLHVVDVIPESTLTAPRERHNLHEIGWKPVRSSEPVTLKYLIEDYVGHLQHHLQQIRDCMQLHSQR